MVAAGFKLRSVRFLSSGPPQGTAAGVGGQRQGFECKRFIWEVIPRDSGRERGSETREGGEQVGSVGSAPRNPWEEEDTAQHCPPSGPPQARKPGSHAPFPTPIDESLSLLPHILQPE